MIRITHRITTAALAMVLAGGLAACSASDTTSAAPSGASSTTASSSTSDPGRAGDVMFAQMMIPHHQQAVQMADMALAKAGASDDVRSLATEIKAAQDPEIQTMKGWLQEWGAPVSTAPMDHGSGGMMTSQEMDRLMAAEGEDFNKLWLELMTKHHEGAVRMAQDVLGTTKDPEVKALAQAVVKAQTAEIERMKSMS